MWKQTGGSLPGSMGLAEAKQKKCLLRLTWRIKVDEGADEERKVLMFPLINKRETGIQLRRIMDRLGLSARDVQEYLGLGCVQSVYRWLDGQSMPTVDNLYALSELFQMPVDDMLCGNRRYDYKKSVRQNAQLKRLWTYYEKLNDHKAA